ncbi:hypothetical protein BRARA_B02811 [Brassica rapa]|uniref:DUF4283 domain-containing protein n=1 Tax=Brassica campestris TaxID=3711 RepID=A0A398AKM8_BRACM|nr:hypothetical protein BRARA_B02811 [Brassica rapa]RID75787.1 hypothetical protein BRARA_B02811 [Brassica rapa]
MNPQKQDMKILLFMLPRIWNVEGRVVGTDLGMGRFQFAFELEEEIVEVLKMEPFHFDYWMISLVRWRPVLEPNYPSKITFWVRVMDLPLQFRAAETFQSVGEAIGTVQGPVDLIAGRVRVEVDGFKPLVFSVTVEFEGGIEITMGLRYEKLFGFCKECFCLTHEQARCPELIKEDEATVKEVVSGETGSGATSFKAVVANESRQNGDRREGQYGRAQGFQGANGTDKRKGIAREKQGYQKQDGAYHPYKEKFTRGYGEGSSFNRRFNGYGNKRTAFQARDFQHQQRQETGEQRSLNPTKLMLDAFKSAPGGVQGSGLEGSGASSKARKSLLFEEAVPEVKSDATGQESGVMSTALSVQEQGEPDAEAKEVEEQPLHSEALDDANLMLDGVILSDSELLVEGEDLEDWEQGEIMDFAEEEGIDADDIGLGEAETEQKLVEQKRSDQVQSDAVDEGNVPMQDIEKEVALYDEKVAKKKEMKQEAGMTGGAKKGMGQAFVSPRKKLLAKAGAKQGDKAKKGPPKP